VKRTPSFAAVATRGEVESLLSALVRIDSVNPDLVPGGAGETEIARFVKEWMADNGIDVELEESNPARPSVIGRIEGTGGGHALLLNAHLDTVGVVSVDGPHAATTVDGRLYGRGAYDMKGGLAAIMLAAAAVAARPSKPRGDVIVTAVADEEHASLGTLAIVKRQTADAAIVTEPTGLDVCVAHQGFAWFEIEAQGRAAHGGWPADGIDAITGMGRALLEVEALNDELATRDHPLLGSPSIHASLISGGQDLASYPDRCVLGLERRTVPGETANAVTAEVQALVQRAAMPDRPLTSRALLVREPFETSPNHEIVRLVREEADAICSRPAEVVGQGPWTDAALLSAAGIPTVIFGPGGSGAHSPVEWVSLEDVTLCAAVVYATIGKFCA
jgi:acetylornithine deacetylase